MPDADPGRRIVDLHDVLHQHLVAQCDQPDPGCPRQDPVLGQAVRTFRAAYSSGLQAGRLGAVSAVVLFFLTASELTLSVGASSASVLASSDR